MCTYLKLNKVTRQNDFCPPLAEISDGNVPCKEPLASEVIGQGYEAFANQDYKEVLLALCEGKEVFTEKYRELVRLMPARSAAQINLKVVACLLWFGIPAHTIMRVLRVGKTTFYKAIKSPSE
jgi:hypothetical protein